MASIDRLKLMHLSARMYYMEGRTQREIAEELHISRPKVSRLLSQAREEGIVSISVNDPLATVDTLADLLKDELGLSSVVVVPSEGGKQEQIRRRLGRAAARYLEESIQKGDVVGIGWGRTLHELVKALKRKRECDLTVIPLMGGLVQIAPSFQVHAMARVLSEQFGGIWKPFYVPAIVESESIQKSLLASEDVNRVVESWTDLTVALVGIGNLDLGPEVQMLFVDYLDGDTRVHLEQSQAVGDICMRFFDIRGKPIVEGLPGVISIELDRLHQVPRRIGVAGGKEKAEAIVGAVSGGYINVLITDETAARRIHELVNKKILRN